MVGVECKRRPHRRLSPLTPTDPISYRRCALACCMAARLARSLSSGPCATPPSPPLSSARADQTSSTASSARRTFASQRRGDRADRGVFGGASVEDTAGAKSLRATSATSSPPAAMSAPARRPSARGAMTASSAPDASAESVNVTLLSASWMAKTRPIAFSGVSRIRIV